MNSSANENLLLPLFLFPKINCVGNVIFTVSSNKCFQKTKNIFLENNFESYIDWLSILISPLCGHKILVNLNC